MPWPRAPTALLNTPLGFLIPWPSFVGPGPSPWGHHVPHALHWGNYLSVGTECPNSGQTTPLWDRPFFPPAPGSRAQWVLWGPCLTQPGGSGTGCAQRHVWACLPVSRHCSQASQAVWEEPPWTLLWLRRGAASVAPGTLPGCPTGCRGGGHSETCRPVRPRFPEFSLHTSPLSGPWFPQQAR